MPDTRIIEPKAIRTAAAWRERIRGCSAGGGEYIVWDDDTALMITTGTGDGCYAYRVSDVADWLMSVEGIDATHGLDDTPDETWYTQFCGAVDHVTDYDTALLVWREEGLCVHDGGTPVICEDDLPAACVKEAEVIRLLAEELECAAADLTVRVDDTADPAPGGQSRVEWNVTIDCTTDLDATDTIEIVTQYGAVECSVA